MTLLQKLLSRMEPKISKEDAIQIAKNLCTEHDWLWLEPIAVVSRLGSWIVRTNDGWRGSGAFIKISKKSGEIISAEYYPR